MINIKKPDSKKKSIIDVFCGCGGLSLGFENAGYDLKLAVDNDSASLETFILNRKWLSEEKVKNCDLKTYLPEKKIIKDLRENLFILAGGVPCQTFSTANRQPRLYDSRNLLYQNFLKWTKLLQPQIILVENVLGIMRIKEQIINEFKKKGYTVQPYCFNASDFGLPQNRKRIFFIGCSEKKFSNGTHGLFLNEFENEMNRIQRKTEKFVLIDALSGLPRLKAKTKRDKNRKSDSKVILEMGKVVSIKSSKYLRKINQENNIRYTYNHIARFNNPRDREIFRRLPQGGNAEHHSISDIMPYKTRRHIFKDKYYKLKKQSVCKTITSHMRLDCNMYIHPTQARGLTPREAARIQGFPDNYIFSGRSNKTYEQIGNAVPPPLAQTIGESIKIAAAGFKRNEKKEKYSSVL